MTISEARELIKESAYNGAIQAFFGPVDVDAEVDFETGNVNFKMLDGSPCVDKPLSDLGLIKFAEWLQTA